jgi:hypothetical protein
MRTERAYRGMLPRTLNGRPCWTDIILCCPGDWPLIKERLADGEQWSTLRMGVQLIAVSPDRFHEAPAPVVEAPKEFEGPDPADWWKEA